MDKLFKSGENFYGLDFDHVDDSRVLYSLTNSQVKPLLVFTDQLGVLLPNKTRIGNVSTRTINGEDIFFFVHADQSKEEINLGIKSCDFHWKNLLEAELSISKLFVNNWKTENNDGRPS